ncbi:MAG TPA: hypothetical protein VLY45_05030 [Nitrospiria bacterium]|nr:hypothetical protein [Nitrospiria bacterium]
MTLCDGPAFPVHPLHGPHGRRIMAVAASIVLACGFSACGGTKKPLSLQAQTATRINAVIEDLQTRLGRCDRSGIASLLAPPLSNDATFAHGLADLCDRASALHPVFIVERLWLKNAETVRVDLQWTLRANATAPTGPPSSTGGRQAGEPVMVMGTAHFTFIGKDSPRLTAIEGDNPFAPQADQVLLP